MCLKLNTSALKITTPDKIVALATFSAYVITTCVCVCVCVCICVCFNLIKKILTRYPVSANLCVRCYMEPERIKPVPKVLRVLISMSAIWHLSLFLKGLFFDLLRYLESYSFLFLKILTMYVRPHLTSDSSFISFMSRIKRFPPRSNPLVVIL